MQNISRCAMSALLAFIFVGCATTSPRYQTPTGDKSALATIIMSEYAAGISQIDDANTISAARSICLHLGYAWYPRSYCITPGMHTLKGVYGALENPFHLWLNAEAGKEYLLRSEAGQGRFRMWFEDSSDGKIVGGMRGSDDMPRKQENK